MTNEMLRDCFHNLLTVKEENGYLYPMRHTEKQCEFNENLGYGDFMGRKAYMAAGVTLEMDTNAEKVTLHYVIKDGYPYTNVRRSGFDVVVNGVLKHSYLIAAEWGRPQTVTFALGEGEKRVVIWLPHTLVIGISDITVPEGKVITPIAPRKKTMLMMGDSITHGIGSFCSSLGYAMQTAAAMKEYEVINQSIAAIRFEPDYLDDIGFEPEIITVALGTNDWSKRADKADYDKYSVPFFARINELYPNAAVLVISPVKRVRQEPDLPVDRPNLYRESELYDALCAQVKKYPQMRCIPGWTLVPHIPGCFLDGLHPNELGMTFYANGLLKYLK